MSHNWPVRRAALFLGLFASLGCSSGGEASPPQGDAGPGDGASSEAAASACGDSAALPAGVVAADDGKRFAVACGAEALELSVIEDSIVRLRYARASRTRPSYALADGPHAPATVRAGSRDGRLVVCTADLEATIAPADCRLRLAQRDGAVLVEDGEGDGLFRDGDKVGVRRRAPIGERYYGFGLRTGTSLDRRGRVMQSWTTDAYDAAAGGFRPDADPLYEAIPFYVSLRDGRAWGVFTDVTHELTFDVAATDPNRTSIVADGGEMEQYVFAGPAIRDVLRRYTSVTGRISMPPRWALGFHQSRWEDCASPAPDSMFCSSQSVSATARRLRDEKIPADGLFLDIQHMNGFRSFTWDAARFADPSALVADLASQGFHASVIVDPGIKVDPAYDAYATGLAAKHFLSLDGASPFVGKVWPGDAVFPDFSSPAARAWWQSLVARDVSRGVGGVWIDMNEPSEFGAGTVPNALRTDGDGVPSTMAEMHNVYGLLEARATFEGMRAAAPAERPFILTRAAFAGTQRYAAVWTGDAPSTWITLQTTLPMLLGLGLSGLPFAGSDVGGYSGRGDASPELFARWMALGSVSPFFRAHAEQSAPPQMPWSFGVDVEDATRDFIGARYELLPYLYSLFHEASETGAPILRPLVYEFQDDPGVVDVADEAMLGPSILVAPIVRSGAAAGVQRAILPRGTWFDYASGKRFAGGATVELAPSALPSNTLPMFVREGSIVPRGSRGATTDAAVAGALRLDLYPGPSPTTFTLREDDGRSFGGALSATTYVLERTPSGATLRATRTGSYASPGRTTFVRVRRADRDVVSVTLGGSPLPRAASVDALVAPGFAYDPQERTIVVAISDAATLDLAFAYDATIAEDAPPVSVPFVVTVPAGTPTSTAIHVAWSATAWSHVPLARTGDVARGTVDARMGDPLFYKVTRGSWATVEKDRACAERPNRAVVARASPIEVDVARWADACP